MKSARGIAVLLAISIGGTVYSVASKLYSDDIEKLKARLEAVTNEHTDTSLLLMTTYQDEKLEQSLNDIKTILDKSIQVLGTLEQDGESKNGDLQMDATVLNRLRTDLLNVQKKLQPYTSWLSRKLPLDHKRTLKNLLSDIKLLLKDIQTVNRLKDAK